MGVALDVYILIAADLHCGLVGPLATAHGGGAHEGPDLAVTAHLAAGVDGPLVAARQGGGSFKDGVVGAAEVLVALYEGLAAAGELGRRGALVHVAVTAELLHGGVVGGAETRPGAEAAARPARRRGELGLNMEAESRDPQCQDGE